MLLPLTSAADLGTVPPELVGAFNLIFYSSAEKDAVFKALGLSNLKVKQIDFPNRSCIYKIFKGTDAI